MEIPVKEKAQPLKPTYQEIYKGVHKADLPEKKVVWRDCLNCDKEFPGRKFTRLCDLCTNRIKSIDQSIYRYEIK
jgi:predicted RNA-binding protein